MKAEYAEVAKRQREIAHAILKELGTREGVKHKAEKFNADGHDCTMLVKVNGTDVTIKFCPERGGGTWHSFPTGKVRIAVQEGWYDTDAKRYHDKKAGFDFKAIVDYIIAKAEAIKRKKAAFIADDDLQQKVQAQADGVNAALGLRPFQTDVWVSEVKRRLHVHMPNFRTAQSAMLVAEFARDLLKKEHSLIIGTEPTAAVEAEIE